MSAGEDKAASKRERAIAQRRAQILEAALECFLENGYHQTGVRDIAKKAGVSLGNLYNHFPGKHDVLAEIAALERLELAPFLKILNRSSSAPKVLDKFLAAYAKHLADPDTVILTLEISGEAIRKPDIAAMFMDNREQLVAALTAVLERGIAEGDLRRLPVPRETAQLIIEVAEGCAYRCVLSNVSMRKAMKGLRDFVSSAVLAF
ncbi:TetR/AcrR family transcriptional regulator [Leisingera aquaemixtae]|uniref:TetR/AcrR family transcriptional regulator n=1 Tax=Leisingera aquaemixtae TaxID=1396826 RepID=UPI0021A2ADEA|nr:TetR/AcrR family transcriptional regulator [Leisingera aquaemixtae]UWQ24083.1 TetR/AcrR family transcriptional regulator [Leisingera aquaemixtae]UWQ44961.1 TetR/AcrR family transcriptional regulator [Leisingera aquaemixtae]